MSFAKLFETEFGQILCKIDSAEADNYDAEIRIYFEPEGLGVCSAAFNYNDWDKADEAWELLDEERATAIAKGLIDQFSFAKDFVE